MAAPSARVPPPWVRRHLPAVASLGFAARGAVYVMVGLRAARAAAGWGGRPTDAEGALHAVARGDSGDLAVAALALGLLAYALWRAAQSVWDLDHKGRDLHGLVLRASFLGSGMLHAGLALTAAGLLLGVSRGHRVSVRDWVKRALSEPMGDWVVGVAGLITLGVAAWHLYRAFREKESDRMDLSRAGRGTARWVRRIERCGIAARGVTFGIVGWFLVQAARSGSSREAKGLAEALRTLRVQPYGPWLLGAVGLGLVAYGVHSIFCARYRRVMG
jgi:hypothetical protein